MSLDAEIRVLKSSQKSCVNLKQEHPYFFLFIYAEICVLKEAYRPTAAFP